MIRVVIADDQAVIRDGVRAILEDAGIEVVAEAGDGAEAVEAVRRSRPDVVLMDIRMPVMDGIEATRRIGISGLPSRVLILTTFDFDRLVYDAMVAGASAFLLKDAGREQLVAGVRIVAGGEQLVAPTIARRLVERFVGRPPNPIARPDSSAELSGRELEVMKLIARGLSNAEIAEQLTIGEATVKTHVSHVIAKTSSRDRVQVVVSAYESGLVVPDEQRHG